MKKPALQAGLIGGIDYLISYLHFNTKVSFPQQKATSLRACLRRSDQPISEDAHEASRVRTSNDREQSLVKGPDDRQCHGMQRGIIQNKGRMPMK